MAADRAPKRALGLLALVGWQNRVELRRGSENAAIQPPLVDILVPEGRKQETLLTEFNQRRKEPVVLYGVVPKG